MYVQFLLRRELWYWSPFPPWSPCHPFLDDSTLFGDGPGPCWCYPRHHAHSDSCFLAALDGIRPLVTHGVLDAKYSQHGHIAQTKVLILPFRLGLDNLVIGTGCAFPLEQHILIGTSNGAQTVVGHRLHHVANQGGLVVSVNRRTSASGPTMKLQLNKISTNSSHWAKCKKSTAFRDEIINKKSKNEKIP